MARAWLGLSDMKWEQGIGRGTTTIPFRRMRRERCVDLAALCQMDCKDKCKTDNPDCSCRTIIAVQCCFVWGEGGTDSCSALKTVLGKRASDSCNTLDPQQGGVLALRATFRRRPCTACYFYTRFPLKSPQAQSFQTPLNLGHPNYRS